MKKGFTLAEVLITLAIIGVVAALTIPSVILNTQKQEYKTGLKKAISVLNQAISMNIALNNLSPADVSSQGGVSAMVEYFRPQMNVSSYNDASGYFYTTDGMRFQVLETSVSAWSTDKANSDSSISGARLGECSKNYPCYMVVDVNGERNPNVLKDVTKSNISAVPMTGNDMKDLFVIRITDDAAIPVGGIASETMYK